MILEFNGKEYNVIIEYKNNKNMYLRIKDDLNVYITAPKNMKIGTITKFVEENISYIKKHLQQKETKQENLNNKFLYLGKFYDICYINQKEIIFGNDKVFIGKDMKIDTWYKKKAKKIFQEYYDKCFENFKEANFKPELKIRKMKSKWGVCNLKSKSITLNQELMKLNPRCLEYVIYHELSHLVHMNHSSSFWNLVATYVPNYKQIKKEMNTTL